MPRLALMRRSGVPARGIPLGWRLGLTTAVIVTLVFGSLTAILQKRDLERSREAREQLLAEALAPLALDIESASLFERIEERMASYERAYVGRPSGGLQILLRDASGHVVANPGDQRPEERPDGALYAKMSVRSPLLAGGLGVLEVWQTHCDWQDLQKRRWRGWAISLAVAAISIVLSLYAVHHLLVGRPLRRLLDGVTQMEQGYWSGMAIPRGAWEMRWLAYRFRNLGGQLEETVRRLLDAERRATLTAGSQAPAQNGPAPHPGTAVVHRSEEAFRKKTLRRYLLSRLRSLESRKPSGTAAAALAEEVWKDDVPAAERLGDNALKIRLDDAAFRILDPAAFETVQAGLQSLGASRKKWLRHRESELKAVLRKAGLKPRLLQSRAKHAASVWRKMQSKGLSLEQIHDIFAFRVIFATEHECYTALAALHKEFEPVLLRFKDYIAEPKPNGYQSLHTCIRSADGIIFEVQIRTMDMHTRAEGGDPAHWRYKAERTFRMPAPRWSRRLRKRWLLSKSASAPRPDFHQSRIVD